MKLITRAGQEESLGLGENPKRQRARRGEPLAPLALGENPKRQRARRGEPLAPLALGP
jgi:hypothetical protein